MNGVMNKEMKVNKTRIILLLAILFLFNAYKFLGNEGNKSPILGNLFNMILFLFVIVALLHKDKLKKKSSLKQTFLDDYFSIK